MADTKRGQLRLLLWKDFIIRKHKLVTICAAIWACIVIMPFVIVRNNIPTENIPTCSFPARALPSAGLMTFLQSFICTVNNECQPMSSYEIPRYETSKLHSLSQQVQPVLGNETVMELVSIMPNAIKLMSTLARVIDVPDIHEFAKNGIKVKDLIVEEDRANKIMKRSLMVQDPVLENFMQMDIDLMALMGVATSKSYKNKCNLDILSKILKADGKSESLQVMADKLCNMTKDQRKDILIRLAPEINYKKYFTMIGSVIKNLSGDYWFIQLGELISAMFRLLNLDNYMPKGIHINQILSEAGTSVMYFQASNFTYFDVDLLNKFINLFEPTFGDAVVFRKLQGTMQMVTKILDWISNLTKKTSSSLGSSELAINSVNGALDLLSNGITSVPEDIKGNFDKTQQKIRKFFENIKRSIDGMTMSQHGAFDFLTQAVNGLIDILPGNNQHQILFYSTLLAKLIDSARVTVHNNLFIEQLMYNSTSRHREVVPIITGLPLSVVHHVLDGLADDHRVQILTSKIYYPRQLFCDVGQLQAFLKMDKKTVEKVRHQLCSKPWINYVNDLILQFGIMDIRTTINDIASLVVTETLGKDNSNRLYTFSKTMGIFKNFLSSLEKDVSNRYTVRVDWPNLLNISTHSPLLQVFNKKASMSDEIIIAVHLALAREVIKQNPILESQIVAMVTYGGILVESLAVELDRALPTLTEDMRKRYVDMVRVLLATGLEEEKIYKLLTSDATYIFCRKNATLLIDEYLTIPDGVNNEDVVQSLCKLNKNLEGTLDGESKLGQTILKIMHKAEASIPEVINWSVIIDSFQHLYVVLNYKLGYHNLTQWETIANLRNETKMLEEKWSHEGNLGSVVRLSLAVFLKGMDILDSPLFNMTSSVPVWKSMKQQVHTVVNLLNASDYFVQLIIAGYNLNHSTIITHKLPLTISAVRDILSNFPMLVRDGADIFVKEDIDVNKISRVLQSASWPCNISNSLSTVLPFRPTSLRAIRGIENLFCIGKDLQSEWQGVASIKKLQGSNTTSNDTNLQHTFLLMSGEINNIIRDMMFLERIIIENMSQSNITNNTSVNQDNLIDAWKYALSLITDKNNDLQVVRTFAIRLDTILSSLTLNETYKTSSAGKLWEGVSACVREKEMLDECRQKLKASWLSTLKFVAVAGQEMVGNLIQYFEEINEPNASTLQELGFTKKTSLYMLFDKLPDIVGVLLNSYLDQGFMNQIRKATKFKFWDCDAVIENLVIPLGSRVQSGDLQRIKPYLCPSLLFWVSIPTEQNTLFDLFASTQNLFYNTPVGTFKPNVSELVDKSMKLNQLITTSKNVTISQQPQGVALRSKFNEIVDLLLNWNITTNNSIYNMFIETNMQQSMTFIYLSQVTLAMNHISEAISKFNGTVMSIEDFSKNADVKNIIKLFKRRPSDFLEIMYNTITDAMRSNLTIIASLDKMCNNMKMNKTEGQFLLMNKKMSLQLCNLNYQSLLVNVEGLEAKGNEIFYPELAFKYFIASLKNMNVSFDATGFNRTHLQAILKYSIKYAGDLSLPIYLQYLDSVLQHYFVVLSFVSGEDWWSELRQLYNGPFANIFFQTLERSIDIVEDFVTHIDKIKLVRLIKNINVNNTEELCSNISLLNYIPDSTGALTRLKDSLCHLNQTELFKEIPPLTFASQGYESALKLPRTVNEHLIQEHIGTLVEKIANVLSFEDRPKPQFPFWIDTVQVNRLKRILKSLSSKENQIGIGFGVTTNLIDALTFFGSPTTDSDCQICSKLTTWVKQVNLQLFKRDEYEALLCHVDTMNLNDVYAVLKNNLHWDMALREITSKRNYTPTELNKSLNQLLETSSNQLRHSLLVNTSKLNTCLVNRSIDPAVKNTVISNITFYVTLSARLLRMVEAVIPHIHEMEGVNQTALLRTLYADVAHRLPVYVNLSDVLTDASTFLEEWRPRFGREDDVLKCMQVDISKVSKMDNDSLMRPVEYMLIEHCNSSWTIICSRINCSQFSNVLLTSINYTWISSNLDNIRNATFWSLNFVSKPFSSISRILQYVQELLETTARVDPEGMVAGRVDAVLDFLLQVVQRSTQLVSSLGGLLQEFQPLLSDTDLEADLRAISGGLLALEHIRDYVMEFDALKIEISQVFSNHYGIEMGLHNIGINNTHFWSSAAEKVYAGHINLMNILKPSDETIHIRDYVCDSSKLSTVLVPTQLGGVTADDVLGAVSEQFCPLDNEQIIRVTSTLLDNINFTFIGNNIMDSALTMLYSASSLSTAEGQQVMSVYNQMLSVLPSIESVMSNVSQEFKHEPLFAAFSASNSIGDLLGTPHLLTHVGNMLCGKAIPVDENRLYKVIAETEDFTTDADPRQLESLPTEFCRDLYRDILKMNGGKIVWTFVKPLIMGKIFYTPENNITATIMKEVNATFARMDDMRQLVYDMSHMFVHLENMSLHQQSLRTMELFMKLPSLQSPASFGETNMGSNGGRGLSVGDVVEKLSDIISLGPLVEKLSDLLACINLNRIHPVKDEHSLEVTAGQLTLVNEFSAGIVFLNMNDTVNFLPKNIEYKIRMDIDNVPTTTILRNRFFPPGPRSNFLDELRYFRGFIQVQDMVDRAIIEVMSASPKTHKVNERSTREITSLSSGDVQSYSNESWAVYTQQMPYPCYKLDTFLSTMYESQALLAGFFFSLILTVSAAVHFIIWEKESGNTMLMSVMGLHSASHTLSWFLSSLVEVTLAMTLMLLILKVGHVLPYSDPFLLWLILVNFGFSIVAYCYMISKVFFSASLGSVGASIIYLLSYMPFTIVLSLEIQLSLTSKILTALSMSTSFSYILMNVGRYEVTGEGVQWHNMGHSPVEGELFSILHASLLIVFDSVLYAVVGWIAGLIMDRCYTTSSINYQEMGNVGNEDNNSSSKIGVSISGVSMVYKDQAKRDKLVLDNVNIDLYCGEITTLLGHNGAGKTTLIKILTGMLKPTAGTVSIPLHVAHQGQTTTKIGVCPQNDILLDSLSTEEHLYFYARLKTGLSDGDVMKEVQSMLSILDFGLSSQEPVHRLSGGMRRRLCVSVAFVAHPQLVILDEPSSGVDPLARRDIWSLIVRLKEGRTVLLTTHHLDEAELLSDRVIIMHRGQIYTSGSPVALKNNFGSGYKLRVYYSSTTFASTDTLKKECKKEQGVEESAKDLLTVIRTVVKNGKLVNINGKVVEIELPFLSDDGIGNNFLSLTQHLEKQQNKLGFIKFSMDCSSLEQVFFKICDEADGKAACFPETGLRDSYRSVSTSSTADESVITPPPYKHENKPLVRSSDPLHGAFFSQLLSLLHKRLIHYSHNTWLLCILLALPALFVGIALVFARLRPPVEPNGELVLEPGIYTSGGTEFAVFPTTIDPYGPVSFGGSVMKNIITDSIRRRHKQVYEEVEDEFPLCECEEGRQRCSDVSYNNSAPLNDQLVLLADNNLLQDWITTTNDLYITKRYGGWSVESTQAPTSNGVTLIVWYDNTGHHSLPAFLNAVNNAVLQSRMGRIGVNITTYSHPMTISSEPLSRSTILQHLADLGVAAIILVGFSLIPAANTIYIVSERITEQKRLQFLCRVTPFTYWLATFIWDMLIIIINVVVTICLLISFGMEAYTDRENLYAIAVVLILFGFSCNSLSHVLEKLFMDPSMCNLVLFCSNICLCCSGLTILFIIDILSTSETALNIRWYLHKIFLLSPQFAMADAIVEIAKNSIQAIVLSRFGMDTYQSPLQSSLLLYHYTELVVVGLGLFVLNGAIENRWFSFISQWRCRKAALAMDTECEELEVATERYRVELSALRAHTAALRAPILRPKAIQTLGIINGSFLDDDNKTVSLKHDKIPEGDDDILQTISLRKEYSGVHGARVAVQSLTFGVKPGQCFGLLGVNGAGKSSTFRMLTGQTQPTSGKILLAGQTMDHSKLCSGNISYCPQSDALDPLLTTRQQLQFYCQLRGITNSKEVIRATLEQLDLVKYEKQRVHALSGGNKRKLCTAISLMGKSAIVLLDEPTSGMDPAARRATARAIRAACESGRGVLLTTHSLAESEVLCTRIAVLADGSAQALGSPVVLKDRFGGGYLVSIRLTNGSRLTELVEAAQRQFPQSVLQCAQYCTAQLLVPVYKPGIKLNVSTKLSDIFGGLALLNSKFHIEDFTVNESSLDQMFVNFVNQQLGKKSVLQPDDEECTVVTSL